MAELPPLIEHDVRVSDDVRFSPAGAVRSVRVLTFFVGDHGPFRVEYDPKSEGTSEKMRSDIDHQIVELRRLLPMGG